jgi:hypothetical protein
MNKNILIEGFLPANDFFKRLYDLFLTKTTIVLEFDNFLFDKLKIVYEDKSIEKKERKKRLNALLKQVKKKIY